MERILSDEQCSNILDEIKPSSWERVDRFGKYDQTFITNQEVSSSVLKYFNKNIAEEPIFKVLRFNEGDNIPTFSADYSNKEDEYFKRYINTNFIIQIYLNSDFKGGVLSKGLDTFTPVTGFGLIQNKTEKCSISKIEKGTAYILFVFISKLKTVSLL